MHVLVAGSSGLIGQRLLSALRGDGHEVSTLVRRDAASSSEVRWQPALGADGVDDALRAVIESADAVVNLAGSGVAEKRWNTTYKKQVLESRVTATQCLATAISRSNNPPRVFVSGSAGGYYGDTGPVAVDETAPRGSTFLAEVASAWEDAAAPALERGVRVVHPRTGTVADAHGGAFGRLLPMIKSGAGGKLGNGHQWWSLISLRDEVAGICHLIDTSSISGGVNFSAPEQATNAQITDALGAALHRPTLASAPKFAVRAVLGEFADELFIDQRMKPTKLLDSGFVFANPSLAMIVAGLLAD